MQGKLYYGKLRDELMMEEDSALLIAKLFEPLVQDEAYFLHDVGKNEIFTLIHRVFRTKTLQRTKKKDAIKLAFMNTPVKSWQEI